MSEKETIPKQDQNPKPKENKLEYRKGNAEELGVQLLVLLCNKLDVLMNHTKVQVELLQKISDDQKELLNRLKTEDAEDI
ncbi:MAG: hypothetical protein JRJ45_00225 [Deltaproteobacteria bacterium]|nr:hypothetical protein [Deltaproteobacteria bacterium]